MQNVAEGRTSATQSTRTRPRRVKGPSAVTAGSRFAYSMDDAAVLIGVSRSTLYTLIGARELDSITVGYRRLVTNSAIEAFLASRIAIA